MKLSPILAAVFSLTCAAQDLAPLKQALTMHASFDNGLHADFSKGDKTAYVRKGKEWISFEPNEEVRVVEGGKFGKALHFPKKGNTRPQYKGAGVLGYNDRSWNASVSVWLRLTPDEDLEPGYCDPVQIVGDDGKKGFIFLEWSKNETPRFFRYAIRPLVNIWSPTNVQWDEIPFDKRPMVQIANAPFSRDKWTHVVFTVDGINDKAGKPSGSLFMNGERKGKIENWDLTFGWDPAQVALVLGAAYVGHMDDLAVFNRPLTSEEVAVLYKLDGGVSSLR